MAEAVYRGVTPGRFHSPRPQVFHFKGGKTHSGLTIPQTPTMLRRCKSRSRPIHVMSQKEREEMELEEIRKFKFKANPIPKTVLQGTKNLQEIQKRPITVPEPFKLTEIQKKPVDVPECIKFKARPAPKHILEKPQVPPKPQVHITQSVSKKSKSADCLKVITEHKVQPRLGPVRPVPFSFEQRDKEMRKRKEERIKQRIESDRKQASQFKAQPLPGAVKKQIRNATAKESAPSTSSQTSENKENHVKFVARPPVGLHKEPFKSVHQLCVATEKSAAEQKKFEIQLEQKIEELEELRKEREEEHQKAEVKAQAELRAELVHHPKPESGVNNPFYVPD